jgi:hypothetical protein
LFRSQQGLRTAFRWAADHADLDVAATIAKYGGSSAIASSTMSRSPWPNSSESRRYLGLDVLSKSRTTNDEPTEQEVTPAALTA